jgi:hypothetical protein
MTDNLHVIPAEDFSNAMKKWKHVLTSALHQMDPILNKYTKKISTFFFLVLITLVQELLDSTAYVIQCGYESIQPLGTSGLIVTFVVNKMKKLDQNA